MRIAMIQTPFRLRAGGERQILKLAIELESKGHEVEIFTNGVNKDTFPEFFDKVKINVIPYPLNGKLPKALTPQMLPPEIQNVSYEKTGRITNVRRLLDKARERVLRQYYVNALPAMLELGKKIPKKGFDIINNHNFPTEWAGFIAKARLKVPLVWMCNEPPYWFFYPEIRRGLANISWPVFELLDKTMVRYIDEIMVLSHVSEEYVRKAYNRSSNIVRTGVDIELLHNATGNLRKKYGLENSFVLLFVGASKYARRTNLVRALAILSKKYDNVRLIIDTPREKEMLTRLSEKLGLEAKVLLLDSHSDLELAQVYAACDVFIYPSSASPWGLVVTEAMAAAKPVIVPKEVGTSEIIQNYVNGIVVDKASPDEIAEQVDILMNDPNLRKKIGENACQYVKNNLSWEKYAENVENVFQKAIANFRGNM
jgi:glycosyltransferase involved in cell wall biosynthesis